MKKIVLIALTLVALQACKKEEKGSVVMCFCCFDDDIKGWNYYTFKKFKTLGEEEIARQMRASCKEKDSTFVYCGYQYHYKK